MSDSNVLDSLTEAQRGAVTAGDRDIWLTAGAGSGKTRVLTERFLHLHVQRGIPVTEILAITFTEKAAAEMRERIAGRLREIGRVEALHDLPHASIGTIDSFCFRIVREYGDRVGLDPSVRVLDPAEAKEWEEEIWSRLLERWWRERRDDTRALFLAFRWAADPEYPGGVDPTPVLDLIRQIRTAGRQIDEVSFEADTTEAVQDVARSLDKEIELLEQFPREDLPEKTLEKIEALYRLKGVSQLESVKRQALLAEVAGSVTRRVATAVKDNVSRFLDLMQEWRQIDLDESTKEARILLGEFTKDFLRDFDKRKQEEGVAEFLDFLERAVRLLDQDSIAREVRSRFRYLLLDECQDTNELQLDLVRRLRSPGRFLAVGDPKQSIYRFRDADVGAFVEMGEQLGGDTHRADLADNFRSRGEILAWVNQQFPSLWEQNTKLRVPFETLRPGAEFDPKEVPSIEFLGVRGENTQDARKLEAESLAARLQEIGDSRLDEIGYGDMALLFRSTTDMALYERALRRRGIPVVVALGRGFFQTKEVTDLLVGLQLIENPYRDHLLAAALRSPLVSMADDDLTQILLERSDQDFLWSELPPFLEEGRLSVDGRLRLSRFIALLRSLRDHRGRQPAWHLLEQFIEETGYLESIVMQRDGLRRRANLFKLLELTRSIEGRGDLTLPMVLHLLARYRYTRPREPESALDEENAAVRLLTVHAAKGMEFPLVVVTDMGRRPPAQSRPFLFHKKWGIGVRGKSEEAGDGWTYARIKKLDDFESEAEQSRLFYVAVTRAERHLILTGSYAGSTRPRKSWLAALPTEFFMDEGYGVVESHGVPVRILAPADPSDIKGAPPPNPIDIWRDPGKLASQADEAAADRVIRLLDGELPLSPAREGGRTVSEVERFARCPRQFGLHRMFPVPARPEGSIGGPAEGPRLGVRFHRIMERFWAAPGRAGTALSGQSEESEDVLRWQDELIRMPEAGRIDKAPFRETELSLYVPVERSPLRGVIDLLIRDQDGWWIVDYKTDRSAPDDLIEKYRLSLELYALAVTGWAADGAPVRASIYATRHQKFVSTSLSDLTDARDILRRYDEADLSGCNEPVSGTWCDRCSYRRGCPAWEDI